MQSKKEAGEYALFAAKCELLEAYKKSYETIANTLEAGNPVNTGTAKQKIEDVMAKTNLSQRLLQSNYKPDSRIRR